MIGWTNRIRQTGQGQEGYVCSTVQSACMTLQTKAETNTVQATQMRDKTRSD